MKIGRHVARTLGVLVSSLGIIVAVNVADGQQTKVPRVGFLALARFVPPKLFLEDLEKQGFVDGKNVSIDYHFADGRHDQYRSPLADFAPRIPDAIFPPLRQSP